MEVKELKRELSRLSGLDFFNPKYREVFKKFFPEETDEERPNEETSTEEQVKEAAADNSREDVKAGSYSEMMDKLKEKEQDIDKAEDEREIDKIERDKADSTKKRDEKAEEVREESEEIGKEVDDLKGDKAYVELLEARIENELLRGGVREDKLPHAMRLAKSEIGSMEELHKVKDILQDFPEWVRVDKPKAFGMEVDGEDGLTAEERRLKEMGIDPK